MAYGFVNTWAEIAAYPDLSWKKFPKQTLNDWNGISGTGDGLGWMSCGTNGSSTYFEFVTPNNPEWAGGFRLGYGREYKISLEAGGAWCWLSDVIGGPPIQNSAGADPLHPCLGVNRLQGYYYFSLSPSDAHPNQPVLHPSTTYYLNFCAQYFRDKSTASGQADLQAVSFGRPYIEVPPNPPEPPTEPPVPPVEPPVPPVEPPTEPPEPPEPPPPSTGGPNNPPATELPGQGEDGYVAKPVATETKKITDESVGKIISANASKVVTQTIYKEVGSGIPEPQADVESLYRTVSALKIMFEQLTRQRGDRTKSALLVSEVDKVMEAAVRELDKRYAGEFEGITLDETLDTAVPLNSSSDVANALAAHITDTALHTTDAPDYAVWGRRRGTWIRVASFEELSQYIPQLAGSTGISAVQEDAAPVLGGDMDIASNAFKTTLPLGVDLTVGQVCYMDTAGVMKLADASAQATAKTLIALSLTSGSALDSGEFLLWGFSNFPGVVAGEVLYLSPTVPGGLTSTVPSGSGHVIRVVAYAVGNDRVFFAPDRTWMVVA